MRYTTIIGLFTLTCLSTFVYAQDQLDVRGDARIEGDLTIESFAGTNDRNIIADPSGA